MNVGRWLRTVRFLTPKQWFFRAFCRGRWIVARHLPSAFGRSVERTASSLPRPSSATPALLRLSHHVLQLQIAVHGAHIADIPAGQFHFLGRTVRFGAIDRINWRRDLGERNNPLWRMNLSYMGWAVPLLARGEADMLVLVRRVLDSLAAQNRWSSPGVFRDVWHPYSVSHRLINLLVGLALFRAAGGQLQSDDEDAIAEHAKLCAGFLLRNLELDLQYNHLLKNLLALSVFAAALETVPRSLAFLPKALRRSIRQQVLADGGHAERAPMYHALCLIDLRVLQDSGILGGPDAVFLGDNIARMARALGTLSHPDGDIALFNDSWLGEAPATCALTTCLDDGKDVLAETGYTRLAGDRDAIIFDHGACGPRANPGHAHADFLSVEVSVAGHRLLVDTGVPTYSAGALRDTCRSAAQHNGPHIAGAEPIEFWHSFRVGRRGCAFALDDAALAGLAPLWAAGWHSGFQPLKVRVARWIGLWPGRGSLIVDVWSGEAAAEAAGLRFLVPASWQVNAGLVFAREAARVALSVLIGSSAEPEQARWWPRFGEAEPAHAIAIRPSTAGAGALVAASLWNWGQALKPAGNRIEVIAGVLLSHCGASRA